MRILSFALLTLLAGPLTAAASALGTGASASPTHLMLTPGMNDDGLGVFVTSDHERFGHSGSNAGFQSDLTAFVDSGAGMAIMTNSDNGFLLARELALTIARQYGWGGFSQVEKTAIRLAPADLALLPGHYKLDAGGVGEFDLVVRNGRVFLSSTEIPEQELMAESSGKFFLRDDGTPIEIVRNDGRTALTIAGGIHAVKIP
jgi:hypothetical protein